MTNGNVPIAEIVSLAKTILDSKMRMIDGCHEMFKLLMGFPLQYEKDFLIFTAVASETDHLPIGDERKNWDKKILRQKEIELADFENFYKKEIISACKKILRRFEKGSRI